MEKTVNCPNCNTALTENSKFCPECGEKIVQEKHCTHCGEKLSSGIKFCPECGTKVVVNQAVDITTSGPLSYCHASGTAIQPSDRHFRCADCGELFLEQYRFEDKPICQPCAYGSGMAQQLESERAEQQHIQHDLAAKDAERQHKLNEISVKVANAKRFNDWYEIYRG
jgi:predicted RNA-binding Zn-ribbon protein involved in translation (DUF1610 family)